VCLQIKREKRKEKKKNLLALVLAPPFEIRLFSQTTFPSRYTTKSDPNIKEFP
jgi:hypothetical protein